MNLLLEESTLGRVFSYLWAAWISSLGKSQQHNPASNVSDTWEAFPIVHSGTKQNMVAVQIVTKNPQLFRIRVSQNSFALRLWRMSAGRTLGRGILFVFED